MKFSLYIKNSFDGMDIDEEYEANSKKEAVNHWFELLKGWGWTREMIAINVSREVKNAS